MRINNGSIKGNRQMVIDSGSFPDCPWSGIFLWFEDSPAWTPARRYSHRRQTFLSLFPDCDIDRSFDNPNVDTEPYPVVKAIKLSG